MKKSINLSARPNYLNTLFLIIWLSFGYFSARSQPPADEDYPDYGRKEMRTLANGNSNYGFYWGFEVSLGVINNEEDAIFLAGGKAAWIINHSLALGFEGYGFFSGYDDPGFFGDQGYIYGGYGGLFIEPVLGPRFPAHLTFPTLLGAGSLEFDYDSFSDDIELFLVAEPGVTVEFNILAYLRFGISGKYRFTTTLLPDEPNDNFLNGWSGGIFMKFGRF